MADAMDTRDVVDGKARDATAKAAATLLLALRNWLGRAYDVPGADTATPTFLEYTVLCQLFAACHACTQLRADPGLHQVGGGFDGGISTCGPGF